jgi:hypothetical protein
VFLKLVGDNTQYLDYLDFFRQEMKSKGYEAVAKRYIFGKDEVAQDMLKEIFINSSISIPESQTPPRNC